MNKKTPSNLDKYEKMESQIKQWRDAHPRATLTEIEEAVEKELAELREAVVESLVQEGEDSAREQEAPLCPHCQSKMVKNGKKKRRLKTKEGKTITLERQQMRCLTCGMTLFPPGQ